MSVLSTQTLSTDPCEHHGAGSPHASGTTVRPPSHHATHDIAASVPPRITPINVQIYVNHFKMSRLLCVSFKYVNVIYDISLCFILRRFTPII